MGIPGSIRTLIKWVSLLLLFPPRQLDQLVLALPSQDYYLKASSEGDLQAYHKYMVSIAVLLGANATTAEKELQDVVKFEMQLANVI